ncbi:MAG: IS1595 family transposase [Betaproteobacteria bacterium HGW-Betaproteobacteria-6]|jgi:transposase-like protein|nr:MAG: IS1595 family transposase [Betaproteobacteria bacterium HGW-Betaproteobacteria-6]
MKPTQLKRFMDTIGTLSADECLEAKKALDERAKNVETSIVMKEMANAVQCCPHCGSMNLAKAGSKGGRPRFKCKESLCGKSFNAFTGTPLARLRMVDKHIEHAKCMVEKLTIRQTAEKLEIDIHTAFRWRHRFLTSIRLAQPDKLAGVVEADETFFPLSFKGQRKGLPRPAKKRGTPGSTRGLGPDQIPVLVARDRSTGATLTSKLPSRKAKDISPLLVPRLSQDSILCSDGASAYRVIGKTSGIEVRSTPAKKSAGIYHIQNVNAYDSRLKGWMFSFKGVATKYLDNYLGWHRLLDKNSHRMQGKKFYSAVLG